MAKDPRLSNASASAAADAVVDLIDAGGAGDILMYADTIPSDADTAVSGQVLLATLPMSATAFGAASNGVATAASITDDASADATDTVTWGRILSGGGAKIMDFTAGIDSGTFDIEFNTDAFVSGAVISISSLTYTQPKV